MLLFVIEFGQTASSYALKSGNAKVAKFIMLRNYNVDISCLCTVLGRKSFTTNKNHVVKKKYKNDFNHYLHIIGTKLKIEFFM